MNIHKYIIIIFYLFTLLAQEPFDGYTLFCPLTDGPLGGGESYTRLIDNNNNIINHIY